MLKQGVISQVTVPIEWCSGMVSVLMPDGRVRICVDLIKLNQAVRREIHPMMSVDECLAKLGKSKIFTKLDANSSFWQLPFCEESKLLTTFITPFGRFAFNRQASVPLLSHVTYARRHRGSCLSHRRYSGSWHRPDTT